MLWSGRIDGLKIHTWPCMGDLYMQMWLHYCSVIKFENLFLFIQSFVHISLVWMNTVVITSSTQSPEVLVLWYLYLFVCIGARCSSMVRAFAHGAMGHQINPSCWTLWAISRSSQCSMTCVCNPVYGMMHIKEPLLLIGNSSPCGGSGFPLLLSDSSEWSVTICLTPYNCK